VAFRAIARSGIAVDWQVFVSSSLIPIDRDARLSSRSDASYAVPVGPAQTEHDPLRKRAVYMGQLSSEMGYSDFVQHWPFDPCV